MKLHWMQAGLVGVACNAPAYSIAVTTWSLIAASGSASALAILLSGLLMLGILFAYARLNCSDPNCGAAYTWVSKLIHPVAGFVAGWCLIGASILFMVSAALPAGKATLLAIYPSLADNKVVVMCVAFGWLLFATTIVARGIQLAGRLQSVLTAIELGLVGLVLAAVIWSLDAASVSTILINLTPSAGTEWRKVAAGVVIGVFFYWGWDVIFNLSEETRDTRVSSQRAGAVSLVLLIACFTAYAGATSHSVTERELRDAGDNVLIALANKLLPRPFSYLALIAFLVSTVGAMQASLLQFSRTLFSIARDGVISRELAVTPEGGESPRRAVMVDFVLVCLLLLITYFVSTIEEAVSSAIGASGILVAIYYALAACACVVYHLGKREKNTADIVFGIVFPCTSVCALAICAYAASMEYSRLASLMILGFMGLGLLVVFSRKLGARS